MIFPVCILFVLLTALAIDAVQRRQLLERIDNDRERQPK